MSIGKDSIQKRVAKEAPAVAEKAPAKVDEKTPVAPKAPAKKAATTTTAKKPVAKKPAAKKPAVKAPATTVLGNVSPEVVKKVTGKAENTKAAFPRVALTEELPYYLL